MSTHDAGAAKDARGDGSDWGTRELELLYDAVRDELGRSGFRRCLDSMTRLVSMIRLVSSHPTD